MCEIQPYEESTVKQVISKRMVKTTIRCSARPRADRIFWSGRSVA
jgi:hypothetical protein